MVWPQDDPVDDHSHGGTPIAGGFLLGKIPSRNGWWLGVPPFMDSLIYDFYHISSPHVVSARIVWRSAVCAIRCSTLQAQNCDNVGIHMVLFFMGECDGFRLSPILSCLKSWWIGQFNIIQHHQPLNHGIIWYNYKFLPPLVFLGADNSTIFAGPTYYLPAQAVFNAPEWGHSTRRSK